MSLIEQNKQEDLENLARELKSKLLQDITNGRAFKEFKKGCKLNNIVTETKK